MRKPPQFPSFLLWMLLSIFFTFGCAEERDPIDRVQPNVLDKAFFVGEDLLSNADDPEFWSQATLIDVGYGAAQNGLFTSTYAQPMSRVRWEITEDLLIARLAYERIEDTDGKGVGGPTNNGVVVAAFRIKSHFDIVRDYNSTTGEEINVLSENTYDRPWYERAYMRVDFSKNQSTANYAFDTLSLVGIYGDVTYEPLSYYVTDPNHPDAPVMDSETGYMDITTKAFATPGMIDMSVWGWGKFPSCFLDNDIMGGSGPGGSCAPVELTIRHSFRKYVDHDYEPVNWDGLRFQSYGGFFVERKGFTRNYGMSDDKWHRFLARYPIWERSHFYEDPENMTGHIRCYTPETTPFGDDPQRDLNENGTHDECEQAGAGSRCDIYKQRCTLPLGERTVRPIVWYYTEGSDPEYYEPSELAAHDWDVAMRVAIRSSQYAECVRVGGADCNSRFPIYFGQQTDNDDAVNLALEVDDCRTGKAHTDRGGNEANCVALAVEIGTQRGYSAGVISIAQMPEAVVMCHSPVESSDPFACGFPRLPKSLTAEDCAEAERTQDPILLDTCRAALSVRKGDLRYHQINVIEHPEDPSPWGIYTDAEDPLTGEAISASINVWSYVNDIVSQKMVDVVRYIQGELTTEDITEGTYVKAWSEAAEAVGGKGVLPMLTKNQLNKKMRDFTHGHDHPEIDPKAFAKAHPEIMQKARVLKKEIQTVRASSKATSANAPIYNARRQTAQGTEFEAELVTKMVQELYGAGKMPMSEELLERISPLRGGNPSLQRELRQMKENALAERGMCILHEAPAPTTMANMAAVMNLKFGPFNADDPEPIQYARAEKMRRYLAKRLHKSVILHEMGHSIGLRHNFVSSSDAWNYRPQYWQLRTKNGAVNTLCENLSPDGSSCVGPRYFDPVTQEEKDNMIWMFMQSSIMEYPGELTQDMLGLGAYDFAAARMFYGDTVAVYAEEDYAVGTDRSIGIFGKLDNFGGILGFTYSHGSGDDADIHYSQLQDKFDLIRDCRNLDSATLESYIPGRYDGQESGLWHPVFDGLIVSVNGQASRCRQPPVDYVPWDSLRLPTNNESGFYFGGVSVDPSNRIRVPYGFGTDGWADLGNLSVYRHDNGADAYEIFDFLITEQEMGHIFNNYRRRRMDFSVRSAAGRSLSRYNQKLRDGAKGLSLYRNIYKSFATELGYNPDDFWNALGPVFFKDNILASSMVFDHFARMLARPQSGPHHFEDDGLVLRSSQDTAGNPGATAVTIPNGATGFYGNVGIGGRPVENALATDKGEFDSQYTVNAGSYYDKMYSAMLFTESVDNFISSSRTDFVDARSRAVSLADLFPEGYRRMLANALTGDDFLKGPSLAADGNLDPLVDSDGFPSQAIGWTSWWGAEPEICFPSDSAPICKGFGDQEAFAGNFPAEVTTLDPQIGWEQQKFLIAWTMMYLPENQQQKWIDMMRVWELGVDADPVFENRIEFHNPEGKIYVAKTFGTEVIFGETVQRGIAARVMEYANSLMDLAYDTTDGPDIDGDGEPDWFIPVINAANGRPFVKYDAALTAVNADGFNVPGGAAGCNPSDNSTCTCTANRACMKLQAYAELPFFLRQTMDAYKLWRPSPKGIY